MSNHQADDFDSSAPTKDYPAVARHRSADETSNSPSAVQVILIAVISFSLLFVGILFPRPSLPPSRPAIELSQATPTKMPSKAQNSLAWPQIDSTASQCVLRIRTSRGSGSGVAIAPFVVLTARHVVEADETVNLDHFGPRGEMRTIRGTVQFLDTETDLALVRTTEACTFIASLGLHEADALECGDPLVAIGGTAGHSSRNATTGFFTSRAAPEMEPTCWLMSTGVFFGNSGGAVFEPQSWKLVGIVVAMTSPHSTFFIPAPEIAAFILRSADAPKVTPKPQPQSDKQQPQQRIAPIPPMIRPFKGTL